MKTILKYLFYGIMILQISSCSTTRTVPAGDALYTGAKLKISGKDLTKKQKHAFDEDLEKLTRPRPNSKILGIPFKLMFYNMAGDPHKGGFIRKFFRRIGEPPVLFSDVNIEHNSKVLSNYLENRGYFHATSSGDTTVKNKKASATYTVEPGMLYTIKEISFPQDTTTYIGRAIVGTADKSLIKGSTLQP